MSQAKPSTTEIKHWNKLITCKIKCKEMTVDKCIHLYTKFLSHTITPHLSRKIIACHRHSISKTEHGSKRRGGGSGSKNEGSSVHFATRPKHLSFFALLRYNRAFYFSTSFYKLDTWNNYFIVEFSRQQGQRFYQKRS